MDNTSTLDEILDTSRQSTTKYGLGFTGDKNNGQTTFVKATRPDPGDTPETSTTRQMSSARHRHNMVMKYKRTSKS